MNLDPTGANYSATPAASLAGADAVKRVQSTARVQPTRESRERPGEQDQRNTAESSDKTKPTKSVSRSAPDDAGDIFEQQRELRDAAVDRLKDVIDPDLVDGEWPKEEPASPTPTDAKKTESRGQAHTRENPPSALDLFA